MKSYSHQWSVTMTKKGETATSTGQAGSQVLAERATRTLRSRGESNGWEHVNTTIKHRYGVCENAGHENEQ